MVCFLYFLYTIEKFSLFYWKTTEKKAFVMWEYFHCGGSDKRQNLSCIQWLIVVSGASADNHTNADYPKELKKERNQHKCNCKISHIIPTKHAPITEHNRAGTDGVKKKNHTFIAANTKMTSMAKVSTLCSSCSSLVSHPYKYTELIAGWEQCMQFLIII